jgi:hypothetical protein
MRGIDTSVATYKVAWQKGIAAFVLWTGASRLSRREVIQQGLRQNLGRRRQDRGVAE